MPMLDLICSNLIFTKLFKKYFLYIFLHFVNFYLAEQSTGYMTVSVCLSLRPLLCLFFCRLVV